MPRKNKNKYQQYNSDDLKAAVEAVRTKQMSVRAAATTYGVPKTTISDRITHRVDDDVKNGRPPLIPIDIEKGMVNKILYAADKGFGLTRSQVISKAQQVCKTMNITNSFSRNTPQDTKVGKDWFEGLKKRHPEVVMRKPEPLSTSRSRLMNINE